MKNRTEQMMHDFFEQHSNLVGIKNEVMEVAECLLTTYQNGGKVLICGNGGSCCDGDHIVGELMKGFLLQRPLAEEKKKKFAELYGEEGCAIATKLQQGLAAISLNAHAGLISAFCNDVEPSLVYAQQVMGYANQGDIVLGISTSGNAKNVINALMAANVQGATTIALVGREGGTMAQISDFTIIAPKQETYLIQEEHLKIYHFLCAFVESELFEC